jgi:oligopeptide/dipeptide ABC transporter ATP-binding protein
MKPLLLQVNNLTVQFRLKRGTLTAVDQVSFAIGEKETLGIVGETGCGKSATALSILRLIASPPGKIASGEILFEGDDLLKKSEHEMEQIRGHKISMIFQEPMTSLNPSFTIGEQIAEGYRIHLRHSKKIALEHTENILAAVRVPSPRTIMARYPHELSGGLRQRAMIAMALACQPRLLIADEPTTALDVTIQAQILELLEELKEQMNMALLFISHNLGVMARLCDRIGVMYAGSLVEIADKKSLFTGALHPYTIGLLRAVPRPERRHEPLRAIPGNVCSLLDPPPGCRFHPRCFKAKEICRAEHPPLENRSGHHHVACYFPGE